LRVADEHFRYQLCSRTFGLGIIAAAIPANRPCFVGILFMIVYVLTAYRISTFLFPSAS
jgi:hypothetical protein